MTPLCIGEGGDWFTRGVTPWKPAHLTPAVLESFARRMWLKWPFLAVAPRAAIEPYVTNVAQHDFATGVDLSEFGDFVPRGKLVALRLLWVGENFSVTIAIVARTRRLASSHYATCTGGDSFLPPLPKEAPATKGARHLVQRPSQLQVRLWSGEYPRKQQNPLSAPKVKGTASG